MLLKTSILRKNIAFMKPCCSSQKDITEALREIKRFISSKECKHNIILDLTEQHLLTGIKIGVLAATYHFLEYMSGKIYIVVQDKQTKKLIELLNLSNAIVLYSENQLALDNIA